MATTVELDDSLAQEALVATGAENLKDAVEAGLHLLIRLKAQAGIRELRGKVEWEGDLNESRLNKVR